MARNVPPPRQLWVRGVPYKPGRIVSVFREAVPKQLVTCAQLASPNDAVFSPEYATLLPGYAYFKIN